MTAQEALAKIEKLFALAEDKGNEHEAEVAALMAQKLMAQFNLDESDLHKQNTGAAEPKIAIKMFTKGSGYKWRYSLALAIASNFRVKTYCIGTQSVAFYGFETDVEIALRTFTTLFNIGNKLALKVYYARKNDGEPTKGVMNAYLSGFVAGIKEKLDEQCKALMLITPKKVEEEYREFSKNFGHRNNRLTCADDSRAYRQGKIDGRLAMNSNAIEA